MRSDQPGGVQYVKRIESEDETVIDGEQAEAELATDEGLARQLAEYLKVNGTEILRQLPDGIRSRLHEADYKGVFLYYQRRHDGDLPIPRTSGGSTIVIQARWTRTGWRLLK